MKVWNPLVVDPQLKHVMVGVLVTLAVATAIGQGLKYGLKRPGAATTIANLNMRLGAWWWMTVLFGVTLLSGEVGSLVLFALISLLALREYITLVPTRRGDHRALFWSFFLITPLQYYLIAIHWYGMFAIFIPVWVFLLLPTRMSIAGETEHFLERAAKMQWGLMVCVYCVSHAPALLMLPMTGANAGGAKLLLYLVIVDQMSDVLQYCWGKLAGRHKIAPLVSPNKTLEGTVGGGLSAVALGVGLRGLTPFNSWAAAGISLAIVVMGFAGGLTMSAIKRDRGVKDYGTLIRGHGGILDRIDSLCFAAPVFFHLVRYFYEP
jgi:phosphatidate cytidylyltransferase